MSDVVPAPPLRHAFNHAPAALRIFRFAADSAPRVLQLAHVSAFLRECAVEFGSADAALPGALRNEYASGRFFELRYVVARNAARCRWLAAKLLACRSGAPVPAAALAPDVTRHDVNWGAEGARRHQDLQLTLGGSRLSRDSTVTGCLWAQGPVGVTRGKHWFSISILQQQNGVLVGWVDRALRVDDNFELGPGVEISNASGADFASSGFISFGTAPLQRAQCESVPPAQCPCSVGCLLDLDAGAMTVFVDGEPLEEQCEYTFPTDREWFPTVAVCSGIDALFSNAV
jgi:hypothetical protein